MPPLTAASRIEEANASSSLPVEPSARSVPTASCVPSVRPSSANCSAPPLAAALTLLPLCGFPRTRSLACAMMLASALITSPLASDRASVAVFLAPLSTPSGRPVLLIKSLAALEENFPPSSLTKGTAAAAVSSAPMKRPPARAVEGSS